MAKFSKTEQMLIDRVCEWNDKDQGAYEHQIIDRTQGQIESGRTHGWRREYVNKKPKAIQVKALARLVEAGHVICFAGGYYIPKHLTLRIAASRVLDKQQQHKDACVAQLNKATEELEATHKILTENS